MASTILLSYLCGCSFILEGWKSIIYYFKFPKKLMKSKSYYINFTFKRYNKELLNLLSQNNIIIHLTDIHGFANLIICFTKYRDRISLLKKIYLLKNINSNTFNNIIYNEFFLPTSYVSFYLSKFYVRRGGRKVIGIHIRSGIFFNNYSEQYFHKINLDIFYVEAIKVIYKNNVSLVFIISDNGKYVKEMKNYFKNEIIDFNIKGEIVHSRFSLYCDKFNYNALRIVTEFFVLSSCDFIIGTKRSSFSAEACNIKLKNCIFI